MEVLKVIKSCILQRKIYWTYHVNMRLMERSISRAFILAAVDSFEIVEKYADDKYLPSFLIRGENEEFVFHVLIALDTENESVRIVTAYKPSADKWDSDGRTRRLP